ncbi:MULTISPECIES: hypothetical protein [Streptomyces]|uniref:Uncharacterized protein n=1 Tax=Streptomyces canarius TaxID=285453 RepID=A0ABQ3CIT6_9ACTN|nr:hypothetical protein [Streptomyces canarius]GHA15979.1 hypothetical protein GCM10010345_20970 [Streptomyces canarius]
MSEVSGDDCLAAVEAQARELPVQVDASREPGPGLTGAGTGAA